MRIFAFVGRFLETVFFVTAAGIVGTYFLGWRRPFPTSWMWFITSLIGGIISYFCFDAEIRKIIIVSLAWPIASWLAVGILLGIGIAGFESKPKRK